MSKMSHTKLPAVAFLPSSSVFAQEILDRLLVAGCAKWSHTDLAVPVAKLDAHQSDDIWSTVEIDLDDLSAEVPQKPAKAPRRPRAAVAVGLIAAAFEDLNTLQARLCKPGGLAYILTGNAAIDDVVQKILNVLCGSSADGAKCFLPVFFQEDEISASTTDQDKNRIINGASSNFEVAMSSHAPVVVIATASSPTTRMLQHLQASISRLAAVDWSLLNWVLAQAYPGETLPETTDYADVCRDFSLEKLVISLRQPDLAAAVNVLMRKKSQEKDTSFGLTEFPMAPEVRASVTQILTDLQDWRAGRILWGDVTRNIMLAGPPGCGKTEIPRLIAQQAQVKVISGSMAQWTAAGSRGSDIMRAMKGFFEQASAAAPCIAFIDELDSFGDRARIDHNSSWKDMVIAGVLEQLDGFTALEGVIVMAATNYPEKIDAALRRPGRFDRIIQVTHPDVEQMPQAFRWHLAHDLPDADLSKLAIAATGMTGAEVAATVRDARAAARRDKQPLSLHHLTEAINGRRPPLAKPLRWRVAVHECGHALAASVTGSSTPTKLALTARGGLAALDSKFNAVCRSDIEKKLIVSMAGRAAEQLILGDVSAGSGGSTDSDLAYATTTATALEISYGLGDSGTLWRATPEMAEQHLRGNPDLRQKVQMHLNSAEVSAIAILKAHKTLLKDMAKALARNGVLQGPSLVAFLSRIEETKDAARDTCDPDHKTYPE